MKDYESITLAELNTSKFFVDPNNPKFTQIMHKKDKAFTFERTEVSNANSLRYVALMHDPESELRVDIPYYPIRKRVAARLAGFKIGGSGRFDEATEQVLLGQDPHVNRAIIRYCFLTLNIYFVAHAAYVDMYFRALATSYQTYDKDTVKTLDELQKKILAHEQKIFGGDEVNELRQALYAQSKKIELDFTVEAVVKKIEAGEDLRDWNPHGPGNYKPKNPRYAGHAIPKAGR